MYLQAVDLLGVAKAPKYLFVAVYQKAWKEIAKGIPRHVFFSNDYRVRRYLRSNALFELFFFFVNLFDKKT
jgi:hypothetical protein